MRNTKGNSLGWKKMTSDSTSNQLEEIKRARSNKFLCRGPAPAESRFLRDGRRRRNEGGENKGDVRLGLVLASPTLLCTSVVYIFFRISTEIVLQIFSER